jgi:hypothetical protein
MTGLIRFWDLSFGREVEQQSREGGEGRRLPTDFF